MSREIKVVLTTPIDERSVLKIKAVGDRISVDQVSPLIVAERKGDFANEEKLTLLLKQAEVIYGWIHQFPRNLLERTSDLKWIQVMSAGVDRLPDEILKSPIRIVTDERASWNADGGGGPGDDVDVCEGRPRLPADEAGQGMEALQTEASEGADRRHPGTGERRQGDSPAVQGFWYEGDRSPPVRWTPVDRGGSRLSRGGSCISSWPKATLSSWRFRSRKRRVT